MDGRSVVVTGAGRGLGRAYALDLAGRGARVVVNDLGTATDGSGSRDAGPAAQVVEEIRAAGGTAVASTADASSVEGTRSLIDLACAEFGSVDGVVANAGIYRPGLDFTEIDEGLLERMTAIHAFGAWRLVRAAWPRFTGCGRGRVVLVTSAAGLYGMAGNAAYSLLKAGIVGLTRTLAAEGAPHGIRVNAVAPVAWSRMSTATEGVPPEVLERMREEAPPEAVAPVVAALLADDVPVTGEVLSAGRGRVGRVLTGETPGHSLGGRRAAARAGPHRADQRTPLRGGDGVPGLGARDALSGSPGRGGRRGWYPAARRILHHTQTCIACTS